MRNEIVVALHKLGRRGKDDERPANGCRLLFIFLRQRNRTHLEI